MDKVRSGVEGSSLLCVSLSLPRRRLPLRSSPTPTRACPAAPRPTDRPCNTENFVISSLSLIARPRGSSSDCGGDEAPAPVSARASANATPRNLRRRGLELDLPLADAASTLLKTFRSRRSSGSFSSWRGRASEVAPPSSAICRSARVAVLSQPPFPFSLPPLLPLGFRRGMLRVELRPPL